MTTLDALTPRQREVVVLAAEGLSNKAIAKRLCVGEQTIKNHVDDAYARMDLKHHPEYSQRVRLARLVFESQVTTLVAELLEREAA